MAAATKAAIEIALAEGDRMAVRWLAALVGKNDNGIRNLQLIWASEESKQQVGRRREERGILVRNGYVFQREPAVETRGGRSVTRWSGCDQLTPESLLTHDHLHSYLYAFPFIGSP